MEGILIHTTTDKPPESHINEVIQIANILIETKDIIKSDPEADITMQLAEVVKFLSELQVSDES